MTVYLVFTTMLDQTSFVGAYQTRELADETIKMLKRVQFVGKEYWVIEEPVVTKLYQIA
jgi:hypothetical protein